MKKVIAKQQDEFLMIGKNLKRLRSQMGLSLSEVAKLTGVSKTMLSQIERGESTPTISTTWKITNGLKIKFDTLLDNSAAQLSSIKSIEQMVPLRDKSHLAEIYCMVPFSPISGFGYEFFYCIFQPGCDYESEGHKSGVTELIFVYQGVLDLVVGADTFQIKAGSTITFEAGVPHRYINRGQEDAKFSCLVSYG